MIPLRWVGGGRSQKKVSSREEGPSFPGVMRKFCGSPVGAETEGENDNSLEDLTN